MREAVKYVESKLATDIETLGEDAILKTAKTSMSSKIVARIAIFGKMVVDAVKAVKTYNATTTLDTRSGPSTSSRRTESP